MIKPFIKWAGGKTQLITHLDNILPTKVLEQNFNYIEPFVGGGAMLFHMLNKYSNIEFAVINDINEDLINCYKVIKNSPEKLINSLSIKENEYHLLDDNDDLKKNYYLNCRKLFNERKSDNIEQASLFILLNKTCFNGLYRVNKNNLFNVPSGNYKKPKIYDTENILLISKLLQKVIILCGDFKSVNDYVNENSIIYFDPPYKPISKTSNFTSYSSENFNDNEQIRLNTFITEINQKTPHIIISNSDTGDDFFEKLYNGFDIIKIDAKRSINSNGKNRGKITELLMKNY